MRLIKSSFEILEQEPGLDGIYKQIEKAGRTCYKSEDKITESSAKKFVDMLINRGHTACLEQGTVYLKAKVLCYLDVDGDEVKEGKLLKYVTNPYSKVYIHNGVAYVTTNYRVLYENDWLEDIDYLCELTEYHDKRITVRFICDRGVSHELVRHRVFSFAQESTRYCNYSKDKFGNELTFIIPSWYEQFGKDKLDSSGHRSDGTSDMFISEDDFCDLLKMCESTYKAMLIAGGTPQQARQVLPNALKTEVVMTGFAKDWNHFFKLRCDNAAHPDMRALAIPLEREFRKRNYI